MPETKLHLTLRTGLYLILARELAARACIGSDQFVYWNAKDPRRCLAPDAFVKLGAPDVVFDSWKTWERGTPELAVEILSESDDRDDKLDRYHELGVRELVTFDPGDARVRVWDRIDDNLVERVVEGKTTPSLALGAYWVVSALNGVEGLRLARDADGVDVWPTDKERVAALEAELRRRGD